jgi:cyanophycinase
MAALAFGSFAQADATRAYLFGGGQRPTEIMRQFVREAGGPGAPILVVAWAAEEDPVGVAQGISAQLEGAAVTISLTPPRSRGELLRFIGQLMRSRAIFFSGGDQSRILDVFDSEDARRLEVRELLAARVRDGMLYGGTSAGTAAAADVSITGYTTPRRPGLGIVPGAMVDTHFFYRDREPRLRQFLAEVPTLFGLGVEQDCVVVVSFAGEQLILSSFGPRDSLWVAPAREGATGLFLVPGAVNKVPRGDDSCRRALAP